MAVLAGQDDFQHPATRALLSDEVAGLAAAAAEDPSGLEAQFVLQGSAEMIWELAIATSSDHDSAVYSEPGFAEAYRAALADGFAQGAEAYARDFALTAGQVTMLSDWVTGGGDLIAMHPDKQLAGLLGLTDAGATLSNAYMRVDATRQPGPATSPTRWPT